MVRLFNLIAIIDALAEHAILVADTIAHNRQLQCCTTVEKTRRQAPETTVAQTGIRLRLDQILITQAEIGQGLFHFLIQPQVKHRIPQGTTHQKFQRQVVTAPRISIFVGLPAVFPALHQTIADSQCQRFVSVIEQTTMAIPAKIVGVVMADIHFQRHGIHSQRRDIGQFRANHIFDSIALEIHHILTPWITALSRQMPLF